jgi:hypothetical protein
LARHWREKGLSFFRRIPYVLKKGEKLLSQLEFVNPKNIGALGHSYGGNTVLFLSALDERVAFGCASGSGATYKNRIQNNVGIEMSSVIPGFHGEYDIDDVVSCIAPRRLLIVSADGDKYSKNADYVVDWMRDNIIS